MASNTAIRTGLIESLCDDDFRITDISDYLAALSVIDTYPPDLAIIGEELVAQNGWDICRWLSDTINIPVIMVGTGSGEVTWEKVLEYGADFYFGVPFKPAELSARVRAILRRYQVTT